MARYFLILVVLMAVIACDDDTWKGSQVFADLEWSALSNGSMFFNGAKRYCDDMGGRLPTVDELRKVIINCPGSTYGGACQITDSCLDAECWSEDCHCDGSAGLYSALGDEDILLWSSSIGRPYDGSIWRVNFYSASVDRRDKATYLFHVRCVR
ncbi:MAG TPA: hypothetical protein P5077_07150 [bacterium]|nr:hypothetical protein [bacterium]